MRENSFDFYDRYKLGDRDAVEEPGWRSVWATRARLGVAHLEPSVTAATATAEFPNLILSNGTNRHDDRYMEVHVFGELSWENLSKATLAKPLTTAEGQDEWLVACQKLDLRGITIIDTISP
jgi:hypothetical protein